MCGIIALLLADENSWVSSTSLSAEAMRLSATPSWVVRASIRVQLVSSQLLFVRVPSVFIL